MKLIIATQNAGKIEAAKRAFEKYFTPVEITGITVPSNVSEQPVNEETFLGAKNRVKNLKQYCKENNLTADLYLAVESGIVNLYGEWAITNFAVIEDNNDFFSFGTSPSFPVPKHLVNKIIETDLSQVMNNLFTKDDERSKWGGGIQLLSQGKVTRIDLTEAAFIMALTKYLNKNWN